MANFKTHITVASLISGGLAGSLLAVDRVTVGDVWALFALGALGGVLPDLDSDESTPTQLLFSCFGALLAFLALFAFARRLSILELWLLVGLVFVLVRYVLGYLFARWTTHRGIFHSLAAAAFFGLATVIVVHWLLGQEPDRAWLYGAFLSLGYGLHLILDELYAVDLNNHGLKRSFGSGIKPLDFRNWRSSAAMLIALVLALLAAPKAEGFLEVFGNGKVYSEIYERFLPENGWPLLGDMQTFSKHFPITPG